MQKLALALLATAAWGGTAFAADMAVKAPRAPEVQYSDWSSIYVGAAAGFGWGREKLNNPINGINNLFGTPDFNGEPIIVQNDFTSGKLDPIHSLKQNGFMAGGFAGAQKQLGMWVLGLEVSFDATGMKSSFDQTAVDRENVIRFVPTTFSTVPVTVTVPGQTAPVTNGTFVIPDQKLTVAGQDITIPGQTMTIGPQGINVTNTITGLPPGLVIPAGTPIPVVVTSGDLTTTATLISTTAVTVGADGKAVWNAKLGGTISAEQASIITKVETAGGTVATKDTVIRVNGQDLIVKGTTVVISGQTAAIKPVDITIPGQNITIGAPSPTTRAADVTRSVSINTKIDEIFDARGKIGLAFGQNWMLYGTGGASVAHMTKRVELTQTTAVIGDGSRTNTFAAEQGETRLGWVAGAGLDWRMTENWVLGVLYRHHEFPKGTVTFSDGANSVGFGSSTARVDSIQGRLSVHFPVR